jgi:hypothetical protein
MFRVENAAWRFYIPPDHWDDVICERCWTEIVTVVDAGMARRGDVPFTGSMAVMSQTEILRQAGERHAIQLQVSEAEIDRRVAQAEEAITAEERALLEEMRGRGFLSAAAHVEFMFWVAHANRLRGPETPS